jgi:hypothetical protein
MKARPVMSLESEEDKTNGQIQCGTGATAEPGHHLWWWMQTAGPSSESMA